MPHSREVRASVPTRHARGLAAALAAVSLVWVACGDAPADRQAADDASGGGAPADVRPGEVGTATGAGITADIALEEDGDQVSVRVMADGLVPDEHYPVNVHDGGCDVSGRVRLPMGRVTGRGDGTGSVRMSLARDRLPDRPFAVRILDPDGQAAACVQVDPEPRSSP
jgi:hypothetical protein